MTIRVQITGKCWYAIIATVLTLTALLPSKVAAALVIDGVVSESEWSAAQVYEDFSIVQPNTLNKAEPPMRVRMLSLPEGLAISFVCEQAPDIERIKPQRARDTRTLSSDFVYAIIDFDGTANRAYEFTVSLAGAQRDGTVANENMFTYDWDGRWQSAVYEEEHQWTVEMLIPWNIAPMRENNAKQRTLAVQFGRALEARGERHAWPAVSLERKRYLSSLARVDITPYQQSILDVLPYISSQYNFKDEQSEANAGVDVFWRPSGKFQLSATVNPDFGQVESDNIVVNFSAIETFLSDKRPFFTENQSLFDLRSPAGGLLVYTRRIGGPADDNRALAAQIDVAVKTNGSVNGLDYGAYIAQEAGEAGRQFMAARALLPGTNGSIGYLGTYTERPFLEKEALVNVFDWRWRAATHSTFDGMFIDSRIRQATSTQPQTTTGSGGWMRWQYAPNAYWQNELSVTYLDQYLDFNDFGYLPRNNLGQLYVDTSFTNSDFAATSSIAAVTWNAIAAYRTDAHGAPLQSYSFLTRLQTHRSGGRHYSELRYDPPGRDNLISSGNGSVERHSRLDFRHSYRSANTGQWRWLLGATWFEEGYENDHALQLEAELNYSFTNSLDMALQIYPLWSKDWLIWRLGTGLNSYKRTQVMSALQLNWFPAARHEVRLKTQWIVIDAFDATNYQIVSGGYLERTGVAVPNLQVSSFALQLRYRYEFSAQRELYIVYGRGGRMQQEEQGDAAQLFIDSFNLNNTDQVFAKLRWRF